MSTNQKPKTVGAIGRTDENGEKHVFLFQIQPPAQCELCGTIAELRPYGPNGANICFECGEKDKSGTTARCRSVIGKAMGYE